MIPHLFQSGFWGRDTNIAIELSSEVLDSQGERYPCRFLEFTGNDWFKCFVSAANRKVYPFSILKRYVV